jgi:hypothetical protein
LNFTQSSPETLRFRLDWVSQLNPTVGQRMAPEKIEGAAILCGQAGNLQPVVFVTGGATAVSSPFPALTQEIELPPGGNLQIIWCHAALESIPASFEMARSIVARPWEAEIARLEMINAARIEIYTGNQDWDLAFALSQNLAYASFVGPGSNLPNPSFVLTRQPDQGYSLKGDGSDYPHLWNGQPTLEAYYLSGLLLPGGLSLIEGVLRNYCSSQEPAGFIDWKPGLAGQRSRLLAPPLLATLALRIYRFSQNLNFLARRHRRGHVGGYTRYT